MSIYGITLYVVALGVGSLYGFLLLVHPRWTLGVPDQVWETEKNWISGVALQSAAQIFALVVLSAILIPVLHLFQVRLAVGAATLVVMGISIVGDIKRNSRPGLTLDFGVMIPMLLALAVG